ncbi:electron transfer flavoprotein subunit beta [Sphingomonas sp. CL5.1]|uniref:electron transfer flavoprotein subunit beta/FixA family protein n=1 Tax=Sphingomonas sp. CL5.1 TaxID=2653203 RepID=UPI001583CBBF|nr:electron transfer flavoprotein subunit beta [Sphingomonas sp. CL5.1]QKS01152.1 electron transfer flavoprotein subunit beta [Sphingomonas sp. CL5.1]
MNVLVLVAGVLDPKWPIAPEGRNLPVRDAGRLILSRFDEAALEIALKIRDGLPDANVRALVVGGGEAERLARSIVAFNVTDVAILTADALWDQGAAARSMAGEIRDADLILIGREFGDCDDGLVPPMLAALLGFAFFGCVQSVMVTDTVELLRETGRYEERLIADRPILASVTNDRRTRLRKPLMKNVVIARQAHIARRNPPSCRQADLELHGVSAFSSARETISCRLLAGTNTEQAEQLADLLIEARR